MRNVSQLSQVINLKPVKLSKIWLPLLLVMASGGLLALFIFGMLGYQVLYWNKIYPGVLVDGQAVGGLTPLEVTRLVTAETADRLARPVTIQAGEKSWTFTSQELGMRVNAAAVADAAYAVGRQGNLLVDMLNHLRLLATPHNVEPIIQYDTGPLNQTLQRLAAELDRPPQNAELLIHANGTVEVTPSHRGRRLHPEGTRAELEAALLSAEGRPAQGVIQEVLPAVVERDLEPVRWQVETFLREPLRFGFQSETDAAEWRVEPERLAEMIAVVEGVGEDGKPEFKLEFDEGALVPYLETFAERINVEPVDAQLKFDTESEELVILQPSQTGRTLDMAAATRQLANLPESVAATGSHYLALPVAVITPTVSSDDIDRLGITELVSESTSYFKGSSQGRMNNIALAASKFDGVVVPPGQIFSFNTHLGEVTKESGYDESLIIYGNRTTVGIGGGVCQVSTTAFRAAFYGGFELVERWAHGYRVGWYETASEPGLDATVYSPDVDLRFRNDTDHFILIQTETDLAAGTLTFRFYGTDTGREVLVSEPEITNVVEHGPPLYEDDPTLPVGTTKQVDWAIDGMDVTITRTVKMEDDILHQDRIYSQYRPWRAVYKVGAGKES